MRIWLIAMFLLIAQPAWSAWDDVWRTAPAGAGNTIRSVRAMGIAYLKIADTVALSDTSQTITLTAPSNIVCLDTDTSQLDDNGALVLDLFIVVGAQGSKTAASRLVATLNNSTHCGLDVPPGEIFFDVTTGADTVGEIKIIGRGDL